MNTNLNINNIFKSSSRKILNAGKTTNFVFKIENYIPSENEIFEINSIETKYKIKDRIRAVETKGGKLFFEKMTNDVFKNNLVLIDSLLPNILSEIVKTFYTTSLSSIKDLTANINKINPLNFDNQFVHTFYEYKLKRLLTDVALGMTPAKVWNGIYNATGGFLIVKENGDVLCYHIYNRNQFEDYLFQNTKLETASSTRHDFGRIYQENAAYYFKLNLQVRFK